MLKRNFQKLASIKAKSKDKETGKFVINMPNLIKRHGGILGLCAIVSSSPYDVPPYLPETVTYLCSFINDPVPIQVIYLYFFLIKEFFSRSSIYLKKIGLGKEMLE